MTNSEARKRGQAAASQVQGAAEVGADEWDAASIDRLSRDLDGVETLAVELREMELQRQRDRGDTVQSADTPRSIAADVIASQWLAERVAEARAEEGRRIAAAIRTTPWERVYPNPRPVPPDDQGVWMRGVSDGVEFAAYIAERGDDS